jgi:hypothetical protein
MSRISFAARAAVLGCVATLLTTPACGDDDAGSNGGTSGSGNAQGGNGPGKSAGGEFSGEGGSGTTSSGGQESPAAGRPGTSGNATMGGSNDGGGSPRAAGGASNLEPPGPAPGGGSVYAVECSGETEMCGVEGAHCLGVNLDTGGAAYACSNRCETVDDCSDLPSGAAAEVGCVQFTQQKRCVLVCYNQPDEYACPDGMSCYIYPNSPIGYCLWVP